MKQKLLALLLTALVIPTNMWAALAIGDYFTVDGITYKITNLNPYEVQVGKGENKESSLNKNTTGEIVISSQILASDGNKYTVSSIGDYAFYECTKINSITIPITIKSIGQYAFYFTTQLKSINIPNSTEAIGAFAFMHNHMKAITIPNSVKTIGERAFMHCSELEEINIGSSVNEIGSFLFNGCEKLTSITVDADNKEFDSRDNCNAIIKTSTNKLMEGCQSTVIPNTVETIGTHAFHGCDNLESIAIPKSVLSIEYQAFGYCRDLKSISISSGVSEIDSNPFIGCSSLKNITVDEENRYFDSRNGCNAIVKSDNNELVVGCQNTFIENTVEAIGYGAFGGCTGLSSIIIPNSVKSIKGGAFSGCSNITKVDIPNSVKTIYSGAFQNCSNLTSVTIPNTLKIIELGLFQGCKKLSKIAIPETVEVIERMAFMDCSSLTSLTIPGSVEEIWERAFEGCEALTEVYSLIRNPFKIPSDCWNKVKTGTIPLYVPADTKALYEATEGWKEFKNIVEMGNAELEPLESETIVTTDNLSEESLVDNVVNDVYYNVGENGYDAADQSIVISETTNMGQIADKEPGSKDVKENFNGMILKVAKGKGLITVNVKTSGNAQLVVQVGNGTPMLASKTEKGDVVFSYDVEEDTYVYIYAIIGSSAAKGYGINATDTDSSVRIYSITVSPGATGIRSIEGRSATNDDTIYDLQGRRVKNTAKGVYIVGGRKYSVK